jgi:hypothetical protein
MTIPLTLLDMGGGGLIGHPLFQRPNSKKTLSAKNLNNFYPSFLISSLYIELQFFIKTIWFACKMHLKRPIQKVEVQKAAAISNACLRYTYFKIT